VVRGIAAVVLHAVFVKREHCTAFWAVQDPSMPCLTYKGWNVRKKRGKEP